MNLLHDSPELQAARLMLLVLPSSATEKSALLTHPEIVLPGDSVPSTGDQLLDYLVKLPKPAACQAAPQGRTLLVSCQEVNDAATLGIHIQTVSALDAGSLGLGRALKTFAPDTEDAILAISQTDQILISRAGFQRWYTDYVFPRSLVLSGQQPSSLDRGLGVTYVIKFARIEAVDQPQQFRDSQNDKDPP